MARMARRRILVIDDEWGPRESLRYLLKREYEVFCAESVDEGVAQLKAHPVDTIIMDVRMPGKSGIEGLKEVRQVDPDVSVIMLTGYGALETAQEALRLGANDYQKKPFDVNEMMQTVKRHVERTHVERQRRRTTEMLAQLNSTLVDELQKTEKMASLGQVSDEFVHDLRNPLTIILGYVELLSQELHNARHVLGGQYAETTEYLSVIEENVERCEELTRMWRNMSEGHCEPQEPVDLTEILESLRKGVDFLAAHQKTSVQYVTDLRGAKVMCSKMQLLRAVHNVVTNAMHAVPETGGQVRVVTREGDDYVEIEVEDNGTGINPNDIDRIFEPYFTTKKDGKGSGLGLAITKKIIDECRGTIKVRSKLGVGTVVNMRIPVVHDKDRPNDHV